MAFNTWGLQQIEINCCSYKIKDHTDYRLLFGYKSKQKTGRNNTFHVSSSDNNKNLPLNCTLNEPTQPGTSYDTHLIIHVPLFHTAIRT